MRKEGEFAGIQRVWDRWVAEIEAKLATARELGLLAREVPVPADLAGRIDLLRRCDRPDRGLKAESPRKA